MVLDLPFLWAGLIAAVLGYTVFVIAWSIQYTWLFNNTKGSVLPAATVGITAAIIVRMSVARAMSRKLIAHERRSLSGTSLSETQYCGVG